MTNIYSVLTIALLLASASTSIIDLNSTATTSNTSTFTPQYNDTFLVLNSTQPTVSQQLNYSLYLLSSGSFIKPNSSLAAAVQRSYINGTIEYHLYIYSVDGNYSIQEYEAVVRLASNDTYVLLQFVSYAVTGNGTSSDPVQAPNYLVAPQASSLSEVVNKLTVGYTQLNSSQIISNDNINSLDKQLRDAFSLSGANLAYAAQQQNSASETGYLVFYTMGNGSNFHFKVGSGIYNSDYKSLFIQSLLQIQIPAALVPQ